MTPSASVEALEEQFVIWSGAFYRFYWDSEEAISGTRKQNDAPTLLEVVAFFLFVLQVRAQATKQDIRAMEDLYLRCAGLAAGALTTLGNREYVRDLLDDRVERYFKSAQTGNRKNIASFFQTPWSPLKNQLAWARHGNVTEPAGAIPMVNDGIVDSLRREPVWIALYTHFVAPFMMVLNAVLDDNADYRLLPLSEVQGRIARVIGEQTRS